MHSALVVHGPSPTAKPHWLVFASHTVEMHTRIPTVAVQVATVVGVVGSVVPFASFATHMPRAPGAALHHWEDMQSASVAQVEVQRPLVVSQMSPVCPAQSELIPHLPHVPVVLPDRKQKGSPDVGQASVAVLPLSPLQVAHADDAGLQTGSAVGHIADVVHCAHALVVRLQLGVALGHCESITHASQRPLFTPVVAQMFERQTALPFVPVHGPSPFAKPHSLSLVSHTPLTQTTVPAAAVHVPFSVGPVWAASVGTATPFASWGVHMCAVSLHQLPAPQSASVKQAVPHEPVVGLQNGPGCVPVVQLVSFTHLPQVPPAAQ